MTTHTYTPHKGNRPHIDANALEAMAKQRPDDMFLKGSGVLKLIEAIRNLECANRELLARDPHAVAAMPPTLPEIKDMRNAPQQLNLNDRAKWVLGWMECRDAVRDAAHAAAGPRVASHAQAPAGAPGDLPIEWEPLPEDASERALFDRNLDLYMSDPRVAIATALELWSKSQKGGSYGAMCAIFANEVMKMHLTPTAQAAPAAGAVAELPVEFKQFLADVHTAAGLVSHGRRCKALGERLAGAVMRLLATGAPAALSGWRLVPVEATEAMQLATEWPEWASDYWARMLAAEPTPAAQADSSAKIEDAFSCARAALLQCPDKASIRRILDVLRARVELAQADSGVQEDAARYRTLRDPSNQLHEDDISVADSSFTTYFGADLDREVDKLAERAALAAKGEKP